MDSDLKVKAHTCFLGQTGYAYHSRSFFTALSDLCKLKIRNSTVDDKKKLYLTNKQNDLIIEQSYFNPDGKFASYPPEGKDEIEQFDQDVDIVLETNRHYYYFDQYSAKTKIAYLVWESTRLQDDFFNHLRQNFDYFWCPSSWQKDCMIAQGWPEDRIFVVPEGVDPELKPSNNLEYLLNKEKFVFFLAGKWEYRKSTAEIIRAFLDEFKNEDNVEILCSIDNPFLKDGLTTEERLISENLVDNKIKIIHFPKRQDYIRLMQYSHCHVSCSRAEGWGLPISDSIACGTPTIYAYNTAPMDFASEIGIPVNCSGPFLMDESIISYYEPDFENLKKQMRYVYNNFRELKQKALDYAPKFSEKYSWKNSANKAYERLNAINFKKNDITKNNQCFCITSHCDNKTKIQNLKDCISNLRKYNIPILLYSTINLDENIQNLVDHYFYTKDNPVFEYNKKCLYFNYFRKDVDISYQFPDYGFAAINQITNSLKIAFGLNYDTCHILNYDVIFDNDFFQEYSEHVKRSKNGFFYEKDGLCSNITIISFKNTNESIDILNSISQKDYLKMSDGFAEAYLYKILNKKLSCLDYKEYEKFLNNSIYTTISSQKIFFYDDFSIFYGVDSTNKNDFLIHFFDVKKTIKYDIQLNFKNGDIEILKGFLKNDETIITNKNFNEIESILVLIDDKQIELPKFGPKHIIKFKKKKQKTFVILSYCNNDSKINSLNKLISKIKDANIDISIITPIDIKDKIEQSIDNYLFIDENPLIPLDIRAINSWYIVENSYRLVESLPDHGYAMLNQVRLSLLNLKDKYEQFIFVNYDVQFDDKLFVDCQNDFGFFYSKNDLANSASTLIFQINKPEEFLNQVTPIDEKRYLNISEKMVEGLFFNIFKHLNYKCIGDDSNIKSSQSIINFSFLTSLRSHNFDYCVGTAKNDSVLQILFFHIKNPVELTILINNKQYKIFNLNNHQIINTGLKKSLVDKIEIIGSNDRVLIDKDHINKKIIIEPMSNNHFINIDSNALGDTIAWIPFVEEYRLKNNCEVTCRCNFKELFENEYPYIKFVSNVDFVRNVQFDKEIKLFYNVEDPFIHKNHPSTITLQQVATDLLDIEFSEIKPKISIKNKSSQISGKYVCIGTQSTAQAKYWTSGGWKKLIKYLKLIGYKVICIDKYEEFGIDGYMNKIPDGCYNKTGDYDLDDRITDIYNCDFFIGLGSGLSWLAWALNKPVIMISGFSDPISEFKNKYRVINREVCNSCWNDIDHKFDRTNWLWCPRNKNFECSKKISFNMVKDKVDQLILDNGF